jgi:carbamoyltransferase
MIVLGIHMGHDAAVAVLIDGRIASFIERERRIRVKHAAIATIEDIDAALIDAGIGIADVDRVAVTTTQNWPFLFVEPDRFRFAYAPDERTARDDGAPRPPWESWAAEMRKLEPVGRTRLRNFRRFPDTAALFGAGPGERVPDPDHPAAQVLFTQQFPYHPRGWRTQVDAAGTAVTNAFGDGSWRNLIGGFDIPIRATIHGREIPGSVIPHHLAHAATAFYGSDKETAAIITHDGGHEINRYGYTGGVFCLGEGRRLYPVWFNHAMGGNMYRRVADACGLPGMGGPGKLMGLSSYGKPRFHDEVWARGGSSGDLPGRAVQDGAPRPAASVPDVLYEKAWPYIRQALRQDAPARHAIPAKDPLLPLAKDLAASIQLTFEEQTLEAVSRMRAIADGLGVATDTVCLTGGCALNCPANSRVYRDGPFEHVFVPPTCDDSGLALGGAFYLAHTLFDEPRARQGADVCASAYLGRRISDTEIDRALADATDLRVEADVDAPSRAAQDMAEGRVIGWFEGRSEIGPRALGHRSILADPRKADTLTRVNLLKHREAWRPLAPAVLAERAGDWFEGIPPQSPHMLFTGSVRGDGIPAITHVDGSARVQTVDASAGRFRQVVEAFDALTGVPVVLNTSLNGRGEPIVETPTDAINMFRRSTLDVLYLDGRRVSQPN